MSAPRYVDMPDAEQTYLHIQGAVVALVEGQPVR
jgi:hypothetical protein